VRVTFVIFSGLICLDETACLQQCYLVSESYIEDSSRLPITTVTWSSDHQTDVPLNTRFECLIIRVGGGASLS
jgi:hypothetical protein